LISDFLAAISFLTSLPVGRRFVFGPQEVARSARWFPLVGALLGAVSAGCLLLFTRIFPPLVCAVLLVGITAFHTGAMHLDGLADTADGFGGGATREEVLRIMRDHAIGSYGSVALILAVALKISSIAALIDGHRAIPGLVLAPILGRWSAVLLSATQPYARPSDDGTVSAGAPSRLVGRTELVVATVTALAFGLAIDPLRGCAALALVGFTSSGWAWWCRRRISGITGDTLGAGIEASECLVLLLFTGLR
jgi:cobalamin 5'-phosphate synthase/cobalamin synthase